MRGHAGESVFSPASGYRYEGLYAVTDYWHETGKDGFRIWLFRLEVERDLGAVAGNEDEDPGSVAPRTTTTVQRIVRITALAQQVKAIHKCRCQVCGTAIETPAGLYAEAAHIRALGRPHDGPDVLANLLCLCPNHHVMFDAGSFTIGRDHSLVNRDGSITVNRDGSIMGHLRTRPKHTIDPDHLDYHRAVHGP